MPESSLFLVSNNGRVFRLRTSQHSLEELPYVGLEFKRVSSAFNVLWAIGGDHQAYVFVYDCDVPIRVKEETFENERWNPLDGFCGKLLVTDRTPFSSENGLQNRGWSSIKLPTLAWHWEGDWHLQTTLDGHLLSAEGWSFALDFPCQYHPEKYWNSCVRRRKWVRYRCYGAVNSWSAVPALHKDHTQEPFIDIAVGGQQIPGTEPGTLAVWAVTVLGRIVIRNNVNATNPEGDSWESVPRPSSWEVIQLTVSPLGMVWATAWNGRALIRSGVTYNCLAGSTWIEVPPPSPTSSISLVSMGSGSVWTVSRDNKVWFRRGFSAMGTGDGTGLGWLEMVGKMHMISVSPSDQVFGIGCDDGLLHMRQGVSKCDPSGKGWRILTPTIMHCVSRYNSESSLPIDIKEEVPGDGDSGLDVKTSEENDTTMESNDSSLPIEEHFEGLFLHNESSFGWNWVDAGAMNTDDQQLYSHWFIETHLSQSSLESSILETWRSHLIDQLHSRKQKEYQPYAHFPLALDRSSWVKEGLVKWSLGHTTNDSNDGFVILEWSGTDTAQLESGTLSIRPKKAKRHKKTINMSLEDVTCVMLHGVDRCCVAVHAPSVPLLYSPVLLTFRDETEAEDWVASISLACCRLHGILGAPSNGSVWALTSRGDIFVHDPSMNEENDEKLEDGYGQEINLQDDHMPFTFHLQSGFDDTCGIVIEGKVLSDAQRFSLNLECSAPTSHSSCKCVALHLNPRWDNNSVCVVLNSMNDGKWADEERYTHDIPFSRGQEFEIGIKCKSDHYQIIIDGEHLCCFVHRMSPLNVTHLTINGDVAISRMIYNFQTGQSLGSSPATTHSA